MNLESNDDHPRRVLRVTRTRKRTDYSQFFSRSDVESEDPAESNFCPDTAEMESDTEDVPHKIETQQERLCISQASKQETYQDVKCGVHAGFKTLGTEVPEIKTAETLIKVEFTEDDSKRGQESCKIEDNPQSPNKSDIKAFVVTANPLESLLFNERQRQKINTRDSTLCTLSSPVTAEHVYAVQGRNSNRRQSSRLREILPKSKQQQPSDAVPKSKQQPPSDAVPKSKQQPPSDVPSASTCSRHEQVQVPRSETNEMFTQFTDGLWTIVQGDEHDEASLSKDDTAQLDTALDINDQKGNEQDSMLVPTDSPTELNTPEATSSNSSTTVTTKKTIPLGPEGAQGPRNRCRFCKNVGFKGVASLKKHLDQVHREKLAFMCKICDKRFTLKDHVITHIKHVHTDEKRKYDKTPVVCHICGKVYPKLSVKGHMATHAKDQKRFECGQCGRAFRHACHLRRHEEIHSNKNNYKCDRCDYSCKTKTSWLTHLRKHRNENRFNCDHCPKTFSAQGTLTNHLVSHEKLRQFNCTECDARFGFKGDLARHIRSHTGEKPYSCVDCGASFALKATLKNHQRTHTKEKPYLCTQCGKAFGQNSSYRQHLKTHGVELNTDTRGSFKCRHCGKEFGNTGAYRQHVRAHEKKKE